jgi:fatty-acyl-CoA synthase
MVAEAYFDDAESNTAFTRRWFRTGDFGAWDGAGRLRLLDHRGDRMVVGGENVSPHEVEEALARHPAVAEVCVVAVPAGTWGHEVAAAVVCRPGMEVTLEDLREHAGKALAPFKLPRRLHMVRALPRSSLGKVLRAQIRSRLAEEMAGEDRA